MKRIKNKKIDDYAQGFKYEKMTNTDYWCQEKKEQDNTSVLRTS